MLKFVASRKRLLMAFIVAILVIGGISAGLWVANVFGWRVWRVQEVQAFIGAALPADAADVQFTTRNQYGRIVWLRFSLPVNVDLTSFLTEMGISSLLKDGFTPFPKPNPQEAGISWWQPTSSIQFSGLYWNNGSKILEVLRDSGDSVKTLVYLRVYDIP